MLIFTILLLNTPRNIKAAQTVVYIFLLIALTWRLPLSPMIRWNMTKLMIWVSVVCLSGYIVFMVNMWVGLFVLLALVTTYYPIPTQYSGETMLMVILGAVLYIVFYEVYNKPVMLALLCLFAMANIITVVVQYLNMDFQLTVNQNTGKAYWDIRQGLMDCRNSLSAALAFCLPAAFFEKWKISIRWVMVVAILIGLILAKSVGGILASMPTLFYYADKWFSNMMPKYISLCLVVSLAICGGLVFIAYVDSPGYSGRWAAWRMYGNLKAETWTRGVGLGHWKVVFNRKDIMGEICKAARCNDPVKGLYYAQAHNEVIQADFEMGHAAIVLIVGFLVGVLRRIRNLQDPTCILILVAIVIDSMVFFPFHIPILAIVIIMSLSMMERDLRVRRNEVQQG